MTKNMEVIRATLNQIARKHPKRRLLPADVVEEASDESSPLHKLFCWDNSRAAHEYRLWQARQLIVSVEIVPDKAARRIPEYVSLALDRKGDGGYRKIKDVLSSKSLRRELLQTLVGELKAMQFRYDRLTEAAGVWREARKLEKKLREE